MARTAPAPNLPAIPGMNPGVFVMGGGGGGGGNGAGEADGACGAGATGCGHPSHNPSGATVGDPIDVATGAVIVPPITDVSLPSAFPLLFQRFYRSDRADQNVGLGAGWSHSFAWRIVVGRRYLRVIRPDGAVVEVSKLDVGQATVGGGGLIVIATSFGYVIEAGGHQIIMKPGLVPGAFVATLLLDSFGNGITLDYERGSLSRAVDAVGREVIFRADHRGLITSVEVKTADHQGRRLPLAEYRYDARGALIESADAAGFRASFSYDDDMRLTARTTPNGARFVYRYDAKGRGIETWGEVGEGVLAGDLPPLLADNLTSAKGLFHYLLTYEEGWVEVVGSRGVSRYTVDALGGVTKVVNSGAVHARVLDDASLLVGYTDPVGAVTRIERDGAGRVLAVTRPDGATTRYERAADGALTSIIDPLGGVTTITYAPQRIFWSDPIGATFEVETDARGLIVATVAPNGAKTSYQRDAMGNEVEAHGRGGQITRRTFDFMGRCTSVTDAMGGVRRYLYSDRGDLLRVTDEMGGVEHYRYDGERNLVEHVNADGRVTRLRYTAAGKPVEMVRGDGRRAELRYDREGALVEITNGLGERHRIERNARGLPVAERTFDGRTIRYGYDLAGRVVWKRDANGERVDYAYDACDRLIRCAYADGSEDRYAYDARGSLTRAESGEVTVTFVRNAVGWVTREEQAYAGELQTVDRAYDGMGKVTHEVTSAGHRARYLRDDYGQPLAMVLGADLRIGIERDVLGRELARLLPAGGRIETDHDASGRILRRATRRAGEVGARSGEPTWVGAAPGVTSEQRYHYSSASEIMEIIDSARGRRRFEYDPAGQLLSEVPEAARARLFAYDAGGNLREKSEDGEGAHRYGAGGRLEAHEGNRHEYDDAGRLIERWGPEGVTRYEWTSKGTLAAVMMPDGRVVRYVYDALGRRVASTTARVQAGRTDFLRQARFVWNAEELIHHIESAPAPGGGQTWWERTYCSEAAGAPWAQRMRGAGDDRWTFSVLDPRGVAVRDVDGRGEVVNERATGVWGERARGDEAISRFGLPGQYADETGLAYNRFRYYDPATGRYLSPDPIGIAGGLDLYGYARNNPLRFIDPDGLMPYTYIYDKDGNEIARGKSVNAPWKTGFNKDVDRGDMVKESLRRVADYVDATSGKKENFAKKESGPCAEAAALSELEGKIRKEMTDQGRPTDNASVRAELRKRLKGGMLVTIEDSPDNRGRPVVMAPCQACARMLDDVLGAELAQQIVVTDGKKFDPDAKKIPHEDRIKDPVHWDGVTTQEQQGGKREERPDDRKETTKMYDQKEAYWSPHEKTTAIEARAKALAESKFTEYHKRGHDITSAAKQERVPARKELKEGKLNKDGTLKDDPPKGGTE